MTTDKQVATALGELEVIQASLAAIAARSDPERRLELVQLRLRLAEKIAVVGHACESRFKGDHGRLAECRRRLSAMRSAIAAHQMDWPAVRLGEDDHLYRQSAARARQANADFTAWLNAELGCNAAMGERV